MADATQPESPDPRAPRGGEILYHFTSIERLALIRSAGIVRLTESNIGSSRLDWPPCGEHVGPDVVWLTDEPQPDEWGLGLTTIDGTDKTAVRITVDIDGGLVWWPDFREQHKMHPVWRRVMEKGRNPESWWVVTRPIKTSEFVAVDILPPQRMVDPPRQR